MVWGMRQNDRVKRWRGLGEWVVLFVVLAGTALAEFGPLRGPSGWEEHLTPGFDPPIEKTLVEEPKQSEAFWFAGYTPERAAEFMRGWGPEAVPVLFRLLDDPEWNTFRRKIVQLLREGGEEARRGVTERLAALLADEEMTGQEREVFEILEKGLGGDIPVDLPLLAVDNIETLSKRESISKKEEHFVRCAAGLIGQSKNEEAVEFLVKWAEEGNTTVREACAGALLWRYDLQLGFRLMVQLKDDVSEPEEREALQRQIDFWLKNARVGAPVCVSNDSQVFEGDWESRREKRGGRDDEVASDAGARETVRIRVTDVWGKTIKKISVERTDLGIGFYWAPPKAASILPYACGLATEIESEDGVFSVSAEEVLVSAPGTARELVFFGDDPGPEPVPVTLHTPSILTIKVVDGEGKPVKGAVACHPETVWKHQTRGFCMLPATNEDGVLRFEQVPPGVYVFRVLVPGGGSGAQVRLPSVVAPRPLVFDVVAGKDYSQCVRVTRAGRGPSSALLESWRTPFKQPTPPRGRLLPEMPSKAEQEKLGQEIGSLLGGFTGILQSEIRDVRILAEVTEELELKEPVSAFVELLRRWNCETPYSRYDPSEAAAAMVRAVAKVAGDDALPVFLDLIWSEKYPYGVRREAVIGLGVIGSERSVAAFRMLRDEGFGKAGAPARRASYTHGLKMLEAVAMTCGVIPGRPPGSGKAWMGGGAQIFDGFERGQVSYFDGSRDIGIDVRRFGEEWLVVGIRQTGIF